MASKITTPIGLDITRPIQLRDAHDDVNVSYTGSEPLDGAVWRGGDQPVLFTPVVSWEDPSQGTILATFLGSDTASLEAGQYAVRITVDGVAIPDMVLILSPSPGTATPLTAYCTYEDLLDYFGDLDALAVDRDQTGFARQRHKARTWTDRVIQANRRNGTGYTMLGVASPLLQSWGSWAAGQTDPVLQGYLDDDLLMRTPLLIEMNAKMALAYACQGRIGPDDKTTAWQEIGRRFRAEAEAIACKYIAEFDLNNDGYADKTINCGMTSNR